MQEGDAHPEPLAAFPLERGAPQFFVEASRAGDRPLVGVDGYGLDHGVIRRRSR
jgi:hypothetical protein